MEDSAKSETRFFYDLASSNPVKLAVHAEYITGADEQLILSPQEYHDLIDKWLWKGLVKMRQGMPVEGSNVGCALKAISSDAYHALKAGEVKSLFPKLELVCA